MRQYIHATLGGTHWVQRQHDDKGPHAAVYVRNNTGLRFRFGVSSGGYNPADVVAVDLGTGEALFGEISLPENKPYALAVPCCGLLLGIQVSHDTADFQVEYIDSFPFSIQAVSVDPFEAAIRGMPDRDSQMIYADWLEERGRCVESREIRNRHSA